MLTITAAERRAMRAKAHHLHPVVSIGQHGLTPAVLHEIDVNLLAHELIKVRVFTDARDERDVLLERICNALDAAPVQHIGKLFVLWRPTPEEAPVEIVRRPMSRPRAGAKADAAKKAKEVRLSPGEKAKRARTLPTGKSAPQARRSRTPSARGAPRSGPAAAVAKDAAPRAPASTSATRRRRRTV
jgi:RNA-binding protein